MANKNFPTFEYYHKKDSDTLDIILHGGDVGMDKPFMRKVIETCNKGKNSVLAFNFLYYERGEDHSSGKELPEELATLKQLMDFVHANEFGHIRFIGKSLGGIVASFFLDKLPQEKHSKFSLVILGYVTGSVRLQNFAGPITIIQGEKDKFGDIEKVKKDLKDSKSKNIKYYEIKNASHSFRDVDNEEIEHIAEVMQTLSALK